MTQKYDYNKTKAEFTQEMLNDTIKYQNKYGFDIGNNNVAHNNEADAFRHAYMQSILAHRYGIVKDKSISILHELKGNIQQQDPREFNMDLWNNQQGQQIYNEICKEYPKFDKYTEEQQKDIIAEKVMDRMRNGQLITNLDDNRKYTGTIENTVNSINKIQKQDFPFIPTRGVGGVQKNGIPSGFASDITPNQLMQELEQSVNNQTNQSQQPQSIISGYTNPLTGNNRIFTRVEVDAMTEEEFEKNEKEIMAQVDAMKGKMPTNRDMQREVNSGSAVYVNPYTRSDGTNVKGYYRSKPAN